MYSIIFTLLSLIFSSYAMAMEPIEMEPIDLNPIENSLFDMPDIEFPKRDLYTLPFTVPGADMPIAEPVDFVQTTDSISTETLSEMLTAAINENRDFILARVVTQQGDKFFKEYYELPNLHKFLFAGHVFPLNPDNIKRYEWQSPVHAPIVGEILYFIYNPHSKAFEYFCNDFSLLKERSEKNTLLGRIVCASYIVLPDAARINTLKAIAQVYWDKKQYEKTETYLERAALLNDVDAMDRLGFLNLKYINPPNKQKAIEWLEKSATRGHASAMARLGAFYVYDKDFADHQKSSLWIYKAAQHGNSAAMVLTGDLFAEGIYLEKDLQQALSWYNKALRESSSERVKKTAQEKIDQVKKILAEDSSKRSFDLDSPETEQNKKIKLDQ